MKLLRTTGVLPLAGPPIPAIEPAISLPFGMPEFLGCPELAPTAGVEEDIPIGTAAFSSQCSHWIYHLQSRPSCSRCPICSPARLCAIVEEFETDAARERENVCYFHVGPRFAKVVSNSPKHSIAAIGALPYGVDSMGSP